MKTTVSDRLTNRQLFELCKKEFTLDNIKDPIFDTIYNMFDKLSASFPDVEFTTENAITRWAVQYTLNYNAPQS